MVNSQCAFGRAPQGDARHGPFPYNIRPCRFLSSRSMRFEPGGLRDRTEADNLNKYPVSRRFADVFRCSPDIRHWRERASRHAEGTPLHPSCAGHESPPNTVPRFLAAASAALVRAEIMRPSSSATIAMMPTVTRLAFSMSAATKSTQTSAPQPCLRVAG